MMFLYWAYQRSELFLFSGTDGRDLRTASGSLCSSRHQHLYVNTLLHLSLCKNDIKPQIRWDTKIELFLLFFKRRIPHLKSVWWLFMWSVSNRDSLWDLIQQIRLRRCSSCFCAAVQVLLFQQLALLRTANVSTCFRLFIVSPHKSWFMFREW